LPLRAARAAAQSLQVPAVQVTAPPQAPGAPGGTAPAQPGYQIGPQDELRITVFDAEELTGTYRVDADGFITFPLLGRIAVGGSTLIGVQDTLRTMLAAGFIRNTQLRVDINENNTASIFE